MKKHKTIKNRLQKEVSERCYQIGIPCLEEPKICWNREQYSWYRGKKVNRKRLLGQASFRDNAILVDLDRHKLYNYTFSGIRNTLIHELVHMRWQNLRHGSEFNGLIQRILKGEKFPIREESMLRFPRMQLV